MRQLIIDDILEIHRDVILESGGDPGIRDLSGLNSAISSPYQSFFGQDFYRSDIDKAARMAFQIAMDH